MFDLDKADKKSMRVAYNYTLPMAGSSPSVRNAILSHIQGVTADPDGVVMLWKHGILIREHTVDVCVQLPTDEGSLI